MLYQTSLLHRKEKMNFYVRTIFSSDPYKIMNFWVMVKIKPLNSNIDADWTVWNGTINEIQIGDLHGPWMWRVIRNNCLILGADNCNQSITSSTRFDPHLRIHYSLSRSVSMLHTLLSVTWKNLQHNKVMLLLYYAILQLELPSLLSQPKLLVKSVVSTAFFLLVYYQNKSKYESKINKRINNKMDESSHNEHTHRQWWFPPFIQTCTQKSKKSSA